jgi:hypothetical protein
MRNLPRAKPSNHHEPHYEDRAKYDTDTRCALELNREQSGKKRNSDPNRLCTMQGSRGFAPCKHSALWTSSRVIVISVGEYLICVNAGRSGNSYLTPQSSYLAPQSLPYEYRSGTVKEEKSGRAIGT